MGEKLEILKKCNCCGHEFDLEDVTNRVKKNPRPLYDKNGKVICYMFDCDCGSTLVILVNVIEID